MGMGQRVDELAKLYLEMVLRVGESEQHDYLGRKSHGISDMRSEAYFADIVSYARSAVD